MASGRRPCGPITRAGDLPGLRHPMGLKNSQRLDYQGLAAALDQRGLIEGSRMQVALSTSARTGQPFPEILVHDDLIGDWELSRVVCELFNLPFVPVDFCTPDAEAYDGFDEEFLRRHRIVPVGRFGDLVTIAMPAIVPAEVLGSLAAAMDIHILPVVGTVMTNNRWISDNLTEEPGAQAPAPLPAADQASKPAGETGSKGISFDEYPDLPSLGDLSVSIPDLDTVKEAPSEWSSIFDVGNAAVLMDLGDAFPDEEGLPEQAPPSLPD